MSRGVPRLHVVTTGDVLRRPGFVDAAAAVLETGPLALHLRAEGSPGRLLLELAEALRGRGPGRVLVNDRVDVARLAGVGAHLPEAGLTPAQGRAILGRDALLGRSVHGARAARGPAPQLDFLIFGHVFATRSKPGSRPRGLRGLARVVRAAGAGLPVVAIGGVTAGRVARVLEAGAHGVAVLSGVWEARDPAAAARDHLAALLEGASADPGGPPDRTETRWSSR